MINLRKSLKGIILYLSFYFTFLISFLFFISVSSLPFFLSLFYVFYKTSRSFFFFSLFSLFFSRSFFTPARQSLIFLFLFLYPSTSFYYCTQFFWRSSDNLSIFILFSLLLSFQFFAFSNVPFSYIINKYSLLWNPLINATLIF